jgi:2-oxo-3-hexenedioate decarboxylase
MNKQIQRFAAIVDDAARKATAISQLTDTGGAKLSVADAYEIQRQSILRRVKRGAHRVGMKMGFTSRAKIIQMGVSDMLWGRLTVDMVVEDGGSVSMADYVHPRVEPEIVFLLKKDLVGTVTPLQAMDAVEAIAPAMEIIDSRYENFKFTHVDVVADNSSSSGFVTGPWHRPDIDFSNLGLVLSFNGQPKLIGSTAAILGHPIRSLVAAARFAEEAGEPLKAGWVVMAGGATAAEPLVAGAHVEMEMQRLGRVAFSVNA